MFMLDVMNVEILKNIIANSNNSSNIRAMANQEWAQYLLHTAHTLPVYNDLDANI